MSLVFNFLKIVEGLSEEGPEKPDISWLKASQEESKKFWQDLFQYYSSQFFPIAKSLPFEHYDFYHDMVVRHLGKGETAAFRWQDGGGWQEISYSRLHSMVQEESRRWAQKGICAGKTVCIVLPIGPKYLLSLVTALKMGLTISFLPPQGDFYLSHRIKAIAPDFIVTEYIYTRLLTGLEKLLLDSLPDDPKEEEQIGHTYPAGKPLGLFFSPFSKDSKTPRPLSTDKAYLHALRDATLVFRLGRGECMAALGADPLQYHPNLLFASLLAGSTFVQAELRDLEERPELLDDLSLRSVGIGRKAIEIFLEKRKKKIKNWAHCFKDPSESLNFGKLERFRQSLGLQDTPMSNVLYHAASGGAIFFSLPQKKLFDLNVLPAAGVPWKLNEPNFSGQPSHGNFGLFATDEEEEDKSPLGGFLLVRQEEAFSYLGTYEPRRSGRPVCRQEILDVVKELPFVRHASLVVLRSDEFRQAIAILLLFVGDCPPEKLEPQKGEWAQAVRSTIHFHLGSEFLPDKIEFYGFYAREKEGIVDHAWCEAQYLSGFLYRKSEHPLYRTISRLHAMLETP